MSGHTPGPWVAIFINREPCLPKGIAYRPSKVVIGDRELRICDGVEHDADARLIAAAPDLLAALIALRDSGPNGATHFQGWHEAYGPACELARAAIAKATGEQP